MVSVIEVAVNHVGGPAGGRVGAPDQSWNSKVARCQVRHRKSPDGGLLR